VFNLRSSNSQVGIAVLSLSACSFSGLPESSLASETSKARIRAKEKRKKVKKNEKLRAERTAKQALPSRNYS
jgi:hypothetical protein